MGEFVPRTAFQMISLKSRSSARSSISRYEPRGFFGHGAPRVFLAFVSTRAGRCAKGVKSGWAERGGHGAGRGVELAHRLQSQDQLHRAEHR